MLVNVQPTLDDEMAERVHTLKSKQKHHERQFADATSEAAKHAAEAAGCADLIRQYRALAETADLPITLQELSS